MTNWRITALLAALLACASSVAHAQPRYEAQQRVMPGSGPGVRAFAKSGELYYVLSWADRSVLVYNSRMDLVGRLAGTTEGPGRLHGPWDLAVDKAGNVYVADRGSNQIKVFSPTGEVLRAITYESPRSVAVLSTGEIAVVGRPRDHLISLLDAEGRLLRSIGEPVQVVARADLNGFLNTGSLVVDASDNIFVAFSFLPTPTVRKYDKNGNLLLEFHPSGARLELAVRDAQAHLAETVAEGGAGGRGVISGVGIDPQNGDIWVSCADWIYRFDSRGAHKSTFQAVRKGISGSDVGVNVNDIVFEEERVLILSHVTGVHQFPLPK